MSAVAAMPGALPQYTVCSSLEHRKVHVDKLAFLAGFAQSQHQLTYQLNSRTRKKKKKNIAAEIFKTLLQASTSIQYELFMVCSTLGSFSGLLFLTLSFRSFSQFKLE